MHQKQPSIRHRQIKITALIIVALGFGLRLLTLGSESLWYDELLQLDIAQAPLAAIVPRLRGHSAVPLDYFIAHFWMLLGRSDGWVRLPAVIVGTLTLPVAYQFGRRLLGRSGGLLLLTLLALSPFHIHYSQEVRPYALVVLGVTLLGYAFWRLQQTGHWKFFVPLQAGMLIALLAHIFSAAALIALGLFAAIEFALGQNRRRAVQLVMALLLASLIPLLIYWLMGWGDVVLYTSKGFGEALVQPEKFTENIDLPDQIPGPEVNELFIREKILAPFVSSDSVVMLVVFNGIALVGLIALWRNQKLRLSLLLLLWIILPPIIIVSFLIFRDTFFASRYIISILPAYFLLVSAGLLAVARWFRQSVVSVAIFIVLLALILTTYTTRLYEYYTEINKEKWHLVGDFIAANANPSDAVIAFRAEPTMNWYVPSHWAAPNYYQNLDVIKETVAQSERSWIILSLFSSGVDANVKAWLSEQQAIRLVLDPLIHVYYLGNNVPPDQLLDEIQGFALPVDHALYASLARENRHRPAVARLYYQLALENAPDEETRLAYKSALESLAQ